MIVVHTSTIEMVIKVQLYGVVHMMRILGRVFDNNNLSRDSKREYLKILQLERKAGFSVIILCMDSLLAMRQGS